MSIDWQPLIDVIGKHESFVITTHMRPDCDAIGSALGLAYALRSLSKQARVVNGDPVPPHIAFVDPEGDVEVLGRDVAAGQLEPDVLIVVDTSAWLQLGPMADVLRASSAKKIVIDHHVSEDDFGAEVFKDSGAEATGRLISEVIEALGAPLTPLIAKLLFAAIATDTGWFRFASVEEATFAAAARLVRAGANPQEVFSALYENNSVARLLLQGRILSHVETELGERLIYSHATQLDLDEIGAEPTDTEDVINRLLSVAGSEVAVLFLENGTPHIKVSLRSRSSFDVRKIAEQFGGGGHAAASGARFRGTLEEARAAVLDAIRGALG